MKKILPFLAVAFSGFLVYLFDKIWGSSINWENFKSFKIGELLAFKVSLFQILIFLFVTVNIYYFGNKFLANKNEYYSKKQKKLREFNKTEIAEAGILLRWGVYFDNETPFISELTAFCTKHIGPPIRFIQNRCPVKDCENSQNQFNEYAMKNFIESDLIEKWEKIK